MTLKEFTENHLKFDTKEGQKAVWRRAFPTELRFEEVLVKARWFQTDETKLVLQEKWVRYHKGDVIDTNWRQVPIEYIPNYER